MLPSHISEISLNECIQSLESTVRALKELRARVGDPQASGRPQTRHPVQLRGYGSLHEAARAVADLQYDALRIFLSSLQHYLAVDRDKDLARGRSELSKALGDLVDSLDNCIADANRAWNICRPHMEEA